MRLEPSVVDVLGSPELDPGWVGLSRCIGGLDALPLGFIPTFALEVSQAAVDAAGVSARSHC